MNISSVIICSCVSGVAALTMFFYTIDGERKSVPWIEGTVSIAYGLSSFSLLQSDKAADAAILIAFPIFYLTKAHFNDLKYRIIYLSLMTAIILAWPIQGISLLLVLLALTIGKYLLGKLTDSILDDSKELFYLFRCSLISLGISSYVWLPKIYEVSIESTINRIEGTLFSNWWVLLSRFFVWSGYTPNNYAYISYLYCSVVCFFMFGIFLIGSKEDIFTRSIKVISVVVALAICNIIPFYQILYLYSNQGDNTVHISFLPVFFLLRGIAKSDEKDVKKASVRWLIVYLIAFFMLFFFVSKYAINELRNESVFITLIILVISVIVVVLYKRDSINETSFRLLFTGLVITELIINAYDITKTGVSDPHDHIVESDEQIIEEEETIWDPFENNLGCSPADLEIGSGLSDISIMYYGSGIISLDAHKVVDQFPYYIINYRFVASDNGILYLKHGDTLLRFGPVKSGDKITHKCIHESYQYGAEYEYFQVYYADEEEERSAIQKIEAGNISRRDGEKDKEDILFVIGIILASATVCGLLIWKMMAKSVIKYTCYDFFSKALRGKKDKKQHGIIMYLIAFLIPFSILLISCIYAKVTPFGDNFIFRGDAIVEGMPNMFQARDQILQGKYFYSFSSGGGSNLFYLNPSLPLLVLLIAVPDHLLAEVITYFVLAKVALGGMAMYLYLTKSERHSKIDRYKNDFVLLAFTTAYALSSYQLSLTSFFNWSDIVFLLPITLLMMERLMLHHKPSGYVLVLSLGILLNCYNMIYTCAFLILWFFTFPFRNIWDLVVKGLRFVFYSLLAVGMGFWVICATVLSRVYGAYASGDTGVPSPFLYQSFWKTLGQVFLTASPVCGTGENGMVNLYCGVFSCLLLIYSFWTLHKKKGYLYRILICFFILISSNTSTLDYIWNGFHFQHNMPGRYAYLWVFMILEIAWEVVMEIRIEGWNGRAILYTLVVTGLGGSCTALFGGVSREATLITGLVIIIYSICVIKMLLDQRLNKSTKQYIPILCMAIIIELGINCCYIISDYAQKVDFYAYRDVASWLKLYDPTISELDRTSFLGSSTANQGECGDLGSNDIFSSFMTQEQYYYGASLGMAATNNMIRDSFNLTPLSNALGRVKYIVLGRFVEATGIDLENYKVIGDVSGLLILENKRVVPEGFWISAEALDRLDRAEGREEFLNLLAGSYTNGERVFDKAIPFSRISDPKAELTENGYLLGPYIYENFAETKLSTKAEDAGTYYYGGNCYAYLGDYEQGQSKELDLILLQPEAASLLRFNYDAFERFLCGVTENGLSEIQISDGSVVGVLEAKEDGYLCVPIPYEPGWRVTINGTKQDVRKMRNGMMAIQVKKGRNEVTMSFVPVGFGIGITITLFSILVFFLLNILMCWKSCKTKKRQEEL